MKKVMIYAYTNFNLGDDLFIKILCERYPNAMFYLYAPNDYKNLFKKLNNIKVISSDRLIIRLVNLLLRFLKLPHHYFRTRVAKKCDVLIYIGGSLFMENNNWKNAFKNTKSMYIKNRPFYLLGANFGPYKSNDFYLAHKKLFSEFTDICFRDNYSYELFKDLPNVRRADDLIFQLKEQPRKAKVSSENVVISVIKPSIREDLIEYDEIYFKKIKDIAVYLIDRGYNITLMSFCENEGDKEAVETIFDLLPNKYIKNVKKYFYKHNIEEALEIISNSNSIVATRFHSMILGWVFKKPVFPIVYNPKMSNVIYDIGFNGPYIDIKKINELNPSEVYNGIKGNVVDISKQIKNSEIHFKELDKLLLNSE